MPRYAIYYAPLVGDPLNDAAAQWLGRDVFSGATIDRPSPVEGMDDIAFNAQTRSPRRYGFHGTLKAPFELAEGKSIEQLEVALEDFCEKQQPFTLPKFKVGQLGPFFALLPSEPSEELKSLASGIVRTFDEFRAPLSDLDIKRRNPDKLSESQRDNLLNWGYPYIFDDLRFHMTLTDPVADDLAGKFQDALDEKFAPVLGKAKELSALTLFMEPTRGAPFMMYRQFPFAVQQSQDTTPPEKKSWLRSLFGAR